MAIKEIIPVKERQLAKQTAPTAPTLSDIETAKQLADKFLLLEDDVVIYNPASHKIGKVRIYTSVAEIIRQYGECFVVIKSKKVSL